MTFIESSLVVLLVFSAGTCFGILLGGLCRCTARAEIAERTAPPAEHQADDHYPSQLNH